MSVANITQPQPCGKPHHGLKADKLGQQERTIWIVATVVLQCLLMARGGIAVTAAMQAALIGADIHATDTAAVQPLPLVAPGVQLKAKQLVDQCLVNALARR